MTHTTVSLIAVLVTIVLDLAVLRTRLLGRRAFWVSYAIVLFFQLLTNEWLTWRGVFRYDPDAILGWRIGHAPVEDFAFGFALVMWSMCWWTWWGRHGLQAGPFPEPARRRRTAAPRSSAGDGETPRGAD